LEITDIKGENMPESIMGPLLGKNRIAFDKLDTILPKYEAVTDTIDIYLDVRSVFGIFFNDKFGFSAKDIPPRERMLLSSELMNIVGHYRRYFWSRREIRTRFTMVHSAIASRRCVSLMPEYKAEYIRSRRIDGPYPENARFVEDNLEIVAMMSNRAPGTYFINSGTVDPDCIPRFLVKSKSVSICLSNNPSWAQHACFAKSHLLTLKGNESKLIRYCDVIDYLTDGAYTKKFEEGSIPYRLAEWLLAVSGSKKHNVPGWKGFGPVKTAKYFSSRNLVNGDFYDPESMKVDMIEAAVEEDKIEQALTSFDVLSIRRNIECMTESERAVIEAQLVSNPDASSLEEANASHFGATPIRLGYLFDGAVE
jgi:hypothetical protein